MRAESLFEAAVRGLAVLRQHLTLAAELTRTTVLEVISMPGGLVGRVQIDRLLRWLDGATRDGRDQVRRYQLKRILLGEERERGNRRERYH